MELTINCGSFVEINKLLSIGEINGYVDKYNLEENFLEGTAVLSGKYIKDDSGDIFEFKKEVPFTLVFKDKNININTIDIHNLHFSEVINQGIETTFEIYVEYDIVECEDFIKTSEEKEKFLIESEEKEDFIVDSEEHDFLNISEEVEFIEEMNVTDLQEELNEITDEITKSYEELLDDLLVTNKRDNLEIKEIKKEDNRVRFTKLKENYSTYSVFYLKDEREIEKICSDNNRSLDEVYKSNGDFNEKRRIILK